MKCVSCGSELPGGAEYCAKCGVRVGSAIQPTRAASASANRLKQIGLTAAGLVAAALAAYVGWRAFAPPGKVTEAIGQQAAPSRLTESAGRVPQAGPLTQAPGTTAVKEPEPTEIIDYLKHIKDIERQRLMLQRAQLAELLKQSGDLTYAGASADWTTNEPEKRYQEVYQRFQQSLGQWAAQWQELAARFNAYPKPVPQACTELRDRYYQLLTVTNTAMLQVGNSFSQALSGDPGKALETLTRMQGSGLGTPSHEVTEACNAADEALAAVCNRFKLKKDFDIRDDSGGGNLLGR